MKKNAITLISFVLLGVFISCQREDDIKTNESELKLTTADFANIGSQHNAALTYIYNNNQQWPISNANISIYLYSYMQNNTTCTLGQFQTSASKAESFVNDCFANNTINKDVIKTELRKLDLNSEVTNALTDQIEDLTDQVDILTIEQLKAEVNALDETDFSDTDKVAYYIFKDVFNNSYDFWSNYYGANRWSNSNWVIFNDCLGGVLGIPFSPFGPYIIGAYLSMSTQAHFED